MEKKIIEIGYIAKAHGLKGNIIVKLYDKEADYLYEGLEVFLDEEIYVIESFKIGGAGLNIKLKDVETRNNSELLKGKKLSIHSSLFKNLNEKGEIYLNQYLGFKVFLENELKGKISGFLNTPAHDLFEVSLDSGGVVELPFVNEFIANIDMTKKEVVFNCPKDLFNPDFFKAEKKK